MGTGGEWDGGNWDRMGEKGGKHQLFLNQKQVVFHLDKDHARR